MGAVLSRLHALGPDVWWTVAGRVSLALGGVISIPLVLIGLSPEDQGIYFTYASLIAAQSLIELGFSTAAIQRIGHAVAVAADAIFGDTAGDPRCVRVAGFVEWALRWYVGASILLAASFLPAGMWFLGRAFPDISWAHWSGSWSLLVAGTAAWLATFGFTVALEGLGHVTEVTRARALSSIVRVILLCAALLGGARLWSPGFAIIAAALVMLVGIGGRQWQALATIRRSYRPGAVSFLRELWPFQWRLAASWVAGFFIFQYMVLVIAASQGAVEAGRFGLACAVATGLTSVAASAFAPKQAAWAGLVAKGDRDALDASFLHALIIGLVAATMGSVAILLAVGMTFAWFPQIAQRIPETAIWVCLLGAAVMNQFVFGAAAYLRAHGREPFLIATVVFAVCMGFGAPIAARSGPATVAVYYVLLTALIGVLWGLRIFISSRHGYRRHEGTPGSIA